MKSPIILFALALMFLSSCSTPATKRAIASLEPPKAKKVEKNLEKFGDVRVDPYYWLNERDHADVLDYLKAENAYFDENFAPMKPLQETLFKEMVGRIEKKDQSVPDKMGDYFYYERFEEDSEHEIICRKKGSLDAEEEVLFDANEMAKGKDFFDMSSYAISSDHKVLAMAIDLVGRQKHNIYFLNLETKQFLGEPIYPTTSNMTWAEDGETLLYTTQNQETLMYDTVNSYNIKTKKKQKLYFEGDEEYFAHVGKSRSKKYLIIGSGSKESTEHLLVPAKKPLSTPILFQRRQPNHEYQIEHAGNFFYILSNKDGAKNFQLFRTKDEKHTGIKNWKIVVEHRPDVLIDDMSVYKNFVALDVRKNGLTEIEIINRKTSKISTLKTPEASHYIASQPASNYDSDWHRYRYESMTTPPTTFETHYKTEESKILKIKKVLGEFNTDDYVTKRMEFPSHDGTLIPASIVYKKGSLPADGSGAPTLVYGYGSYGASMEPYFSTNRLSLLNRGFVFAIAHIRGGKEMGRLWYEDGKYLKKKNTFLDFIAVAEGLEKQDLAQKGAIYAMGGSAGGLLMGAAINMRPDLFQGALAQVPFVDVLTTMLDDSLPLTTFEYQEWGNPNEKEFYDYIKSYSPYDNITRHCYPHMLVTTGYHDSQVQYWEPAKWVAKLRDLRNDQNLLLLHTDLASGHSGQAGRFQSLHELAREYAFLIYMQEHHSDKRACSN